ncbi:MAG: ABC transporter permease subunit [Candidatus Heimdallarchaeota archaeon]
MSLTIYRKELGKNIWLILIPIALVGFILLLSGIWPEFKESAEELDKLLDSPLYQAMLSEGAIEAGLGSFEGFYGMELFAIMDFAFMTLTIFLGAGIIAREVDHKTFDTILSYPIPRWKLLLAKFAAINTYIFMIPFFVFIPITLSAAIFEENIDYLGLFLAFVSRCAIFFALSALCLLCASIFLRPRLAYSTAGVITIGSYILGSLAALVESLEFLRNLSLFYYLDGTTIWLSGHLPLDELVIVLGTGLAALVAALVIFQYRELAY